MANDFTSQYLKAREESGKKEPELLPSWKATPGSQEAVRISNSKADERNAKAAETQSVGFSERNPLPMLEKNEPISFDPFSGFTGFSARTPTITKTYSLTKPESDFGGMSVLPTNVKSFARGLGYNTERNVAALLGAAEGVSDFIGAGFGKGVEAVASLGGNFQNPVSEWGKNLAEQYLTTSPTQAYEESIRRRYSPTETEETLSSVGQNVVQMLPSIAAATATGGSSLALNAADNIRRGQLIGQGLFGLQAAGSSAQQAKQEGATTGQALGYGLTSGLLETSIENIAGGIPGLGKGKVAEIATKLKANPAVQKALDIAGEGGEEALSTAITPFIQRAMYDPDAENATADEIVNSAVMGAVAAGVLQAGIELPSFASQRRFTLPTVNNEAPSYEPEPVSEPILESETYDTPTEETPVYKQPEPVQSVQTMEPVSTPAQPASAQTAEQPVKARKQGVQIPIETRTWEDASNRKVNAFQYDHPELRPYFAQAARALKADLASSVKGERFPVFDAESGYKEIIGYTGTKRSVTEPVAQALDNAKLSYAQIEKAIDDLIQDNGQENYAAAKKLELVLDDMMTNGYTDSNGYDVPPDEEYISAREAVNGGMSPESTEYRMSEEEWDSIFGQEAVGPESSVGAAAYGFDPFTNLQGRYGTIQPGENPARIIDVPAQTSDKNRVSMTARTVMEAAATPEAMLPDIAQFIVDGRMSYIPVTNNQRATMAENRIRKQGYQEALSNWTSDVKSGKTSADIIAMGAQLYNAAANSGDTAQAMDILYNYTKAARAGAQATQATRILKTLTPSGKLYMLQKEVNAVNEELSEKGKKRRDVTNADNVPVEIWMQRVGENLADSLASRVNQPQKVKTVSEIILSDLKRFANATAPSAQKSGQKRTEMDRIMDLFQNKTAYDEAWQAAKDTISDTFENDPGALATFEDWLESSLDYTQMLTKELTGQTEITIDQSLADEYLSATTDEARDAAYDKIVQNIADQLPSSFKEKWDAWRYISMLANPRTHVRNNAGNVGFQPVRIIKNEVAAAIESAVYAYTGGKIERTKSFLASPDLYKAAYKDYENVKDTLSGSKYDDVSSELQRRKTIFEKGLPTKAVERLTGRTFDRGILENVRKWNSNLLEFEDAIVKRITYADSLSGYLQANGVTAQQLSDGAVNQELLDKARDYASKEALKATYQDRNQLSDAISALGSYKGDNIVRKAMSEAVSAVLPFKRTPANILARGLEYSPAGLSKSLTYDLAKVKRGQMSATDAIDNIASGLTGTGLMALGAFLAASGVVTGGDGDDEKQQAIDELTGGQNYALNLPGGGSVTLDWLAPEALPFFMGVQLSDTIAENGLTGDGISSIISATAEPMLQMSMLQSLNDLIDSVSYVDSTGKVGAVAGSALVSYLNQAIPTIGGQIERTGENVRYSTYTDKGGLLPTDIQYAIGKAAAKIPGLDYNQVPFIDAWGREESTGTLPIRIMNNFLNTAYTSSMNVTAVDKEIQRLYNEIGDGSVVPSRADKSVTVNGETINLSGDEYVEYAKKKGQTAYNLLDKIIRTSAYKSMIDAEKAATVKDIYEYANAVGKAAVSSYKPDGWVGKALSSGVPADDYVLYRATADQDGNGTVTQGESAVTLLPLSGLTNEQKGKVWQSQNSSWNEEKNPFTGALANAGIDPETATGILSKYSEIDNASYEGESIPRQKQTELSKYLDGLGLTSEQREVADRTYKFYNMFPATVIPYSLDTMTAAAQRKWSAVQNWGMGEEDYLKFYPIVSQSGKKKDEIIQDLMNAGMTNADANSFWTIIKSKS